MDDNKTTTKTKSPDLITESFDDARFMQDSSDKSRGMFFEQTDKSVVEDSANPETRVSDKRRKRLNITLTALALASVTAGAVGINALEGGNSNGESRGDIDGTIQSLTLNPEANLRHDPSAQYGENDNLVLNLGATVEINAVNDIRVLNDTNNGTWYGIPTADIKEVIPNLDTKGDKDNIIWVNEQGVAHIDRLQLPTE